jgi:hypothetical protein
MGGETPILTASSAYRLTDSNDSGHKHDLHGVPDRPMCRVERTFPLLHLALPLSRLRD